MAGSFTLTLSFCMLAWAALVYVRACVARSARKIPKVARQSHTIGFKKTPPVRSPMLATARRNIAPRAALHVRALSEAAAKPHSDELIASKASTRPLTELVREQWPALPSARLEPYGFSIAKLLPDPGSAQPASAISSSNLILVTAMSPTKAGEGKTCTSVGLADALRRIGKRATVCLREPSLGPVFGMKGGAAGGGRSQLVPMVDINLHFTGDIHAVGSAHNLLSAMIGAPSPPGALLCIDRVNALACRQPPALEQCRACARCEARGMGPRGGHAGPLAARHCHWLGRPHRGRAAAELLPNHARSSRPQSTNARARARAMAGWRAR